MTSEEAIRRLFPKPVIERAKELAGGSEGTTISEGRRERSTAKNASRDRVL